MASLHIEESQRQRARLVAYPVNVEVAKSGLDRKVSPLPSPG